MQENDCIKVVDVKQEGETGKQLTEKSTSM